MVRWIFFFIFSAAGGFTDDGICTRVIEEAERNSFGVLSAKNTVGGGRWGGRTREKLAVPVFRGL